MIKSWPLISNNTTPRDDSVFDKNSTTIHAPDIHIHFPFKHSFSRQEWKVISTLFSSNFVVSIEYSFTFYSLIPFYFTIYLINDMVELYAHNRPVTYLKVQILRAGGRDGLPCNQLLRCFGKEKVPLIWSGPDSRSKDLIRSTLREFSSLDIKGVCQNPKPALARGH